jgi:Co/Zn/Cd efflux system component
MDHKNRRIFSNHIRIKEVLRKFFGAYKIPDFLSMMIVSIFTLIANGLYFSLFCKNKRAKKKLI